MNQSSMKRTPAYDQDHFHNSCRASPLKKRHAAAEDDAHHRPDVRNNIGQPDHDRDLKRVIQADDPEAGESDAAHAERLKRNPADIFAERVIDLDHEPQHHLDIARRHPAENVIAHFGALLN